MGDNLMDKVNAFGERLKISGSEVGRRMTEGMSSMSVKVKELFQGQNETDKIIEEATAETLDGPDWAVNLEICDMMNHEKINSQEVIRSIKKRIMLTTPRAQYLALVLLETCVKNCEKAFSEVASERVLDEMVKLIDDPQTIVNNRNKSLILIEQWGESADELRYLPVFEETYKSLKSRGIRFPGRDNDSLVPIFTPPRSVASEDENAYSLADHLSNPPQQPFNDDYSMEIFSPEQTKEAFEVSRNSIEFLSTVLASSPQHDVLKDDLTNTLVQQCVRSQRTIQRIVESSGDNEALLFEALNLNDEIQRVLSKYEELKNSVPNPEPAMIPIAGEPEDSPRGGQEESLIRKPAGSRMNNSEGDDLMNDLDEMIFGKKGATSEDQDQKKKHEKDLITF